MGDRLVHVLRWCVGEGNDEILFRELEKEMQGLQALVLQVTGNRTDERRPQSTGTWKRQKISHVSEAVPSSEMHHQILGLLHSMETLLDNYSQTLLDHHAISLTCIISSYIMAGAVRLVYFSSPERGTEIGPTFPSRSPLMLQGREQQMYQLYQSMREFSRALRQVVNQPELAEQQLVQILQTTPTVWNFPLRCQAAYIAGYSLFQRGRYGSALKLFRQCYQEGYQKIPCACAIVACLSSMGQPMEAVDQLEQVGFQIEENEPEITRMFLYNIGALYYHMRVYNSALDIYSHLFPLLQEPSAVMQAVHQGQLIHIPSQNEVVSEVPTYLVYYQLAIAALHCRQYPKAAVAFSRIFGENAHQSIPLVPHVSVKRMHHEYMYSLLACQDYEHAIVISERVLAQDATDLISLLYKSDALFALGQTEDSLATLTAAVKAIRQDDNTEAEGDLHSEYVHSVLMNNLALVLVCQGNARKAQQTIHEIRSSLTQSEQNSLFAGSMNKTLIYNYCAIAFRRGQGTEACSCWFPFHEIRLDGTQEYYQSLLTSHTSKFRTMKYQAVQEPANLHHFPEPSHYQMGLMTEMCLRYWLSRSMEQMQATGKILSLVQ